MTDPHDLPEPLAADLAALADGRLAPERRAEVEARAAGDPVLARALERQRAAVRAITAAAISVEAPHDLRVRIDALGSRPARPARRRWLPFASFAGAAAAVALALVVALGSGELTVRGAVAAALRAPLATVAIDPVKPALLREQVDGVRFPNYEERFGWRAEGARADTLEDRRMRTVFYERAGRRIAYTIVAGDALEEPGDARQVSREGIALRTLSEQGRTVVTWRRKGRTCVLSGAGVSAVDLVELAAWKAKGVVEF